MSTSFYFRVENNVPRYEIGYLIVSGIRSPRITYLNYTKSNKPRNLILSPLNKEEMGWVNFNALTPIVQMTAEQFDKELKKDNPFYSLRVLDYVKPIPYPKKRDIYEKCFKSLGYKPIERGFICF